MILSQPTLPFSAELQRCFHEGANCYCFFSKRRKLSKHCPKRCLRHSTNQPQCNTIRRQPQQYLLQTRTTQYRIACHYGHCQSASISAGVGYQYIVLHNLIRHAGADPRCTCAAAIASLQAADRRVSIRQAGVAPTVQMPATTTQQQLSLQDDTVQ